MKSKLKATFLATIILFGTLTLSTTLIDEIVPAVGGFSGGWNVSNVNPVIDQNNVFCNDLGGNPGCDNSGSDEMIFDTTVNEISDANGQDIPLDGVHVLVNDTANATFLEFFESSVDFTITFDGTDTYSYNFSFTIPIGFEAGFHFIQNNVTDNQSAEVKSGGESFHSIFISDFDPIEEELLASDGTDEDIDDGAWGNMTADPGDANAESVNYIRVRNIGGTPAQQFTLDFTQTTWASGGNTVDIDGNIGFRFAFTNFSTDNPGNGFTSEGSSFGAWADNDADGAITITFNANDEFVWIQFRVNTIPSPQAFGRYTADFTITPV